MSTAAALLFSDRTAEAAKHTPRDLIGSHSPVRPVFSHSPSSPRPQHEAESMDEATGTKPRNPARSYEERSVTRTSLHVRLVQHVKEPSKVVARKTGASPDTIDLHRQGAVPKSWAQLIAYCRAYPGFALEVVELMGLDLDQDREAYATFLTLMKQARGQ